MNFITKTDAKIRLLIKILFKLTKLFDHKYINIQ